eukprot:2629547-Pyramimonas_sp.AAC.1
MGLTRIGAGAHRRRRQRRASRGDAGLPREGDPRPGHGDDTRMPRTRGSRAPAVAAGPRNRPGTQAVAGPRWDSSRRRRISSPGARGA